MVLISFAQLFNVVLTSVSLLSLNPAYGSQNDVEVTLLGSVLVANGEGYSRFLLIILILKCHSLCVIDLSYQGVSDVNSLQIETLSLKFW